MCSGALSMAALPQPKEFSGRYAEKPRLERIRSNPKSTPEEQLRSAGGAAIASQGDSALTEKLY